MPAPSRWCCPCWSAQRMAADLTDVLRLDHAGRRGLLSPLVTERHDLGGISLAWQGTRQDTGCGRVGCSYQQIHSVPAEAAVAAACAQHLFPQTPLSVCCACRIHVCLCSAIRRCKRGVAERAVHELLTCTRGSQAHAWLPTESSLAGTADWEPSAFSTVSMAAAGKPQASANASTTNDSGAARAVLMPANIRGVVSACRFAASGAAITYQGVVRECQAV